MCICICMYIYIYIHKYYDMAHTYATVCLFVCLLVFSGGCCAEHDSWPSIVRMKSATRQ